MSASTHELASRSRLSHAIREKLWDLEDAARLMLPSSTSLLNQFSPFAIKVQNKKQSITDTRTSKQVRREERIESESKQRRN